MIALAVTLALFGQPSLPPVIKSWRVGAWRVERSTDRFTGAVACQTTRRRIALDGAALMFDTGAVATPAVVRLDNGPPITIDAGSDLQTVRVSPDVALFNPAGGKIGLPLDRLNGVRRVWIRQGAQAWPMRFELKGLDAALAQTRSAGCPGGSALAPHA